MQPKHERITHSVHDQCPRLPRLPSLPPTSATGRNNPLLARMAGFSLHAGTFCEGWQRSRMERLCRYLTRRPITTKRLSMDSRGRVPYLYNQPFRAVSTHVVLEPLDFIARLADGIQNRHEEHLFPHHPGR